MPTANASAERPQKNAASRVTLESLIAELEEARERARKLGDKRTEARAKRFAEQFRARLRPNNS